MSLSPYVLKGKVNAALGQFASVTASGAISAGTQLVTSAATTITAYAGGGQTNATQLSKGVNHVINGAASNSMQVFGAGTDTINDVATATGVAQAAGKSATYVCPVAGKWYRVLSA